MGMRRRMMGWMLDQGRLTSILRRGNMKRWFCFQKEYHEKAKGVVCKSRRTDANVSCISNISTSQAKVVASGAQMNITGTSPNNRYQSPTQISTKALCIFITVIMILTIRRVMMTKVYSSTNWRPPLEALLLLLLLEVLLFLSSQSEK